MSEHRKRMSKAELRSYLKDLQSHPDPEAAHGRADELLLEYINDAEVSLEFLAITRWYS